jgi:hypothetical protein
MNNPMDAGFPGIYEQPNGFRDFQDSRNNPMPGLSFSRDSQTTQCLASAFPDIHQQLNGFRFSRNSMNNPMNCGEDLCSQSLQD